MAVSYAHRRIIFLLVNFSALILGFSTVESFVAIPTPPCQARNTFVPTTTTTGSSSSRLQSTSPSVADFQENNHPNSGTTPPATAKGEEEEVQGQANTRFSVFAPDPNLETTDFRSQLKDNMKADLERRRREDPNRGNQPAKSYLDSL